MTQTDEFRFVICISKWKQADFIYVLKNLEKMKLYILVSNNRSTS